MTGETTAWAAKQVTGSSGAKAVLMALAHCAHDTDTVFPSIEWLCAYTELNRKTVIKCLKTLQIGERKFIEWTGKIAKNSGGVKVYRILKNEEIEPAKTQSRVPKTVLNSSTKNGTAKTPKSISSPNFTHLESQNWDTEVITTIIPVNYHLLCSKKSLIDLNFKPEKSGAKTLSSIIQKSWTAEAAKHHLAKFIDYHHFNQTKSARWQSSWATWVRNTEEFKNGKSDRGNRNSKKSVDGFDKAIQMARHSPASQPGGFDVMRTATTTGHGE